MITLNGMPISATLFPDRTSQVWKIPEDEFLPSSRIVWSFDNESELIHLVQLQALLRSRGIRASLHLPYLPYARQDKAIDNAQTFALTPFLRLIGSLGFTSVSAFDPHNSAAVATHLPNFVALPATPAIQFAINALKPDLVCYPDRGALERYNNLLDFPSIYATKVREQSSGRIESITLSGACDGKNVLMVDDICDGGMTFIKLAETLKASRDIHLYVSHGLFSKGVEVLRRAGIQRIFTKDGEVV
jgi:ribose-phosphate pyrophosphokinase